MLTLNTKITYPILLLLSTAKRSFEALGRIIGKSGDSAKRLLFPAATSLAITRKVAQNVFKDCTELTLTIDDSLLRKIFSKVMAGSGKFFDTKLGRRITAYRLIVGSLTDGKRNIPIDCGFMFEKELLGKDDIVKGKLDFVKEFYALAQSLFPQIKIQVAADGLFTSVELLTWALENKIEAILRMHKNRVVTFQNKPCKISDIACLKPHGKQMARTIQVLWYNLQLFLTAERRIDKNNEESIVFLIATYQARPIQYVQDYKRRWPIEKLFRTSKQYIGIEQCFSTKLQTQENHVASVMLAYAIAQIEMMKHRLDNPEEAIRAIKQRNVQKIVQQFARLDQIFGDVYA